MKSRLLIHILSMVAVKIKTRPSTVKFENAKNCVKRVILVGRVKVIE